MKLVPLCDLFDVSYGNNLELNRLDACDQQEPNAIRFVSRTNKDNGVVAYVRPVNSISPNPANTISVAASGSYVLASFLQKKKYYSGAHLFVLHPKKIMSEIELLFYCHCITLNRFKYSYGRQANRTLEKLLVPEHVPDWVQKLTIRELTNDISEPINKDTYPKANHEKWKYFPFMEIFNIHKGRNTVGKNVLGEMPLVSAINRNNGIIGHIFPTDEPFPANSIAVPMNGVSAGEAYYQRDPFYATTDVNVLIPKEYINPYALLFICTIIKQEKFRFSYGRKWSKTKMETNKIKLPSKATGEPDFEYMSSYIKSLPFSSGLDLEEKRVMKKGLSDAELIEKYEAGSVPMKRIMKGMLATEPPSK